MDKRTILAQFESLPGHEQHVRELILRYATHVRSQRGTLAFEVHNAEADPAEFVIYEVYRDEDAFQEHLAHSEGVRFNQALARHVIGGVSRVKLLKVLND